MHTATAISIQSGRIPAFFCFVAAYTFIKTFKFFSFASASPFLSLAGSGTCPPRNLLVKHPEMFFTLPRRSSVPSSPNAFYLFVRLIRQRTIPIPKAATTAIPIGSRSKVLSPVFTSSGFSGVCGSFLFWISFTTSITFVFAST